MSCNEAADSTVMREGDFGRERLLLRAEQRLTGVGTLLYQDSSVLLFQSTAYQYDGLERNDNHPIANLVRSTCLFLFRPFPFSL